MKFSFFALLLGVALVVACGMRFAAVTYALPLDVMADEFVHVATGLSLLNERTLVASHEFSYVPSLMAVILAPFFVLYGGVGMLLGWFSGISGFTEFAIVNSVLFIAGARVLSAICGIGLLWFVFLFVKRITNSETALLATLLAAFDFWLVHESQAGHIWMPMTAAMAAALYAILRLSETGALRWYLVSAASIAVGFWAGFMSVLLVPFFLGAHFFAPERRASRLLWGGGFLGALLALISVLNPYSFMRQFGRALRSLFELVGISIFPHLAIAGEVAISFADKLALFTDVLFFDNPFVLVLGVGGLVLFAYRDTRPFVKLLVLGVPLLYSGVFFTAWPHPDNRYILPLIPFLVFGTAYALMWAFGKNRMLRSGAALILVVALSWSVISSVSYTKLLLTPDTRLMAYEWVMEHVPEGSSVLVNAQYVELPRNQAVTEYLSANLPSALRTKDRYLLEHTESFPAPAYFALKIEEAALLPQREHSYFIRSSYAPEAMSSVPEGYELVANFYPRASFAPIDELLQNPEFPLRTLFAVTNAGPFVEVFRKAGDTLQ